MPTSTSDRQTVASPPPSRISVTSHWNCSRVVAFAGRTQTPSCSTIAPSRFNLRQVATRRALGSAGIRNINMSHAAIRIISRRDPAV